MHFLGVVNQLSIKGQDGANPSWQRQKQQGFAHDASLPAEFATKGTQFVRGNLQFPRNR
jgi:hypothetical protein